MIEILIVEDDGHLAQGIATSLQANGERAFTLCPTLAAARQALGNKAWDLVILDVSLPDGSGLNFCRELRAYSSTSILFLTANDMEMDIVAGLEAGGDDYLTKPFSLAILRARVNALLRRSTPGKRDEQYRSGDLCFDFERFTYTKDGVSFELSKTEQRLLAALVRNEGQVLTRARLLDMIWGQEGEFVDENALSVVISRLRAKIEADPARPKYIVTVRGLGYRWEHQS